MLPNPMHGVGRRDGRGGTRPPVTERRAMEGGVEVEGGCAINATSNVSERDESMWMEAVVGKGGHQRQWKATWRR